jgi:hypothetical protein
MTRVPVRFTFTLSTKCVIMRRVQQILLDYLNKIRLIGGSSAALSSSVVYVTRFPSIFSSRIFVISRLLTITLCRMSLCDMFNKYCSLDYLLNKIRLYLWVISTSQLICSLRHSSPIRGKERFFQVASI